MDMKVGRFYKVTYTRKTGTKLSFVGMYEGIETSYADCIECAVCDKDGHKRLHQFNIPYNENGTIEEMTKLLDELKYETLYFGTSCIKKCEIEEIKR